MQRDENGTAHFADRVLQADAATPKPRRRGSLSPRARQGGAALIVLTTAILSATWSHQLQLAPFLPALLAIGLITALAGSVAAAVATLLLGLSTILFVIPPTGRFALDPRGWTAVVLFLAAAFVTAGLFAWVRAGLRRAELRSRDAERISHTLRERARESRELAEQLRAAARKAEASRNEASERLERAWRIHGLAAALWKEGQSPAEVAASAIDRAPAILACDTGAVLVAEPEADQVRILASRGLSRSVARSIESAATAEAAPHTVALREGTSVWVREAQELASRFPQGQAASPWMVAGAAALAAVPLGDGDRTTGVLVLGYRTPQAFTNDERRLVALFAQQLEHALTHARPPSAPLIAKSRRRSGGRRRGDAPTAGAGTTAGGST